MAYRAFARRRIYATSSLSDSVTSNRLDREKERGKRQGSPIGLEAATSMRARLTRTTRRPIAKSRNSRSSARLAFVRSKAFQRPLKLCERERRRELPNRDASRTRSAGLTMPPNYQPYSRSVRSSERTRYRDGRSNEPDL